MALPHRIRRLRWQARVPDMDGALAWRRALAEQADQMQAVLARVCDRLAPGPSVRHVPRLALRLAPGTPAQLGPALEAALEAALRDALAQAERESHAGIATTAAPPGAATGPTPADASPPAAFGAAALAEYLRTGRLPWTWAGLEADATAEALREAGVLMAGAASDIDTLWHAWPALGANFSQRLAALLRGWAWWPAAARQRWLARHRPAAPLQTLPTDLRQALPREDKAELAALWLAWPAEPASPSPAEVAAVRDWLAPRRSRGGVWAELARAFEPVRADKHRMPPSTTDIARGPAGARVPMIDGPTDEAPALPQPGRLVPLAGLVLLHPYLPRLLKGLGLVGEPPAEIDAVHLPRACALLHALARGDAPAHEFQLPLVKLLLGHDPDAELLAALPLPEAADLAEADALLDAVRGHWPALRNTSREGLRLSFLQRRGLLTRGDEGWALRLQREPFDLLLATLPWALGPIRLPWMRQPLQVEWPDA